jgi:hypothetical protein
MKTNTILVKFVRIQYVFILTERRNNGHRKTDRSRWLHSAQEAKTDGAAHRCSRLQTPARWTSTARRWCYWAVDALGAGAPLLLSPNDELPEEEHEQAWNKNRTKKIQARVLTGSKEKDERCF